MTNFAKPILFRRTVVVGTKKEKSRLELSHALIGADLVLLHGSMYDIFGSMPQIEL